MIGVAALALYSVYAFVSDAPVVGAVAIGLALFFGRVAIAKPQPSRVEPEHPKEISGSATILICAGATVLFGLLVKPLGTLSLVAFMVPVAAVAYWHFGLRGRQALLLGLGFVLALVTLLFLTLAA